MSTVVDVLVTLLLLGIAADMATSNRPFWRIIGWIFVAGMAAQFVTYGVIRGLS